MSETNNSIEPISIPVAYRETSGTVFSVVMSPDAGSLPTNESFSDLDAAKEFQSWGDDNMWPVTTREKLQDSTTAFPLITKSACLMFGKGLVYYKEVRSGSEKTIDWTPIPEVDEFLMNNNIEYFLLERLMDHKTYGNMFAEFILNKKGDKIVNVFHKEAEFTRFGTIKDNKVIDVKYLSDWSKSSSDAAPIPFCMRRDRNPENIKTQFKSSKKFVIHSCLPSPGSTLYAKPTHFGLVKKGGWLDYANGVPLLMNAINDNAMLLRFHIQIPVSYWYSINRNWDNLPQKERDAIMDKEFTIMQDFLKGSKNAAKNFITHYAMDPITGKEIPGWKITALDDPIKRDQFLTSCQEADIQTTRAINMDVSLAGIQPEGGKMGGGSGSDKRVAYTNSVSMSHAEAMVILEPLYVVKMVNAWDPALKFAFEYDIPTTLNENKSGVKNSTEND
jgi:hypothetical protein